MIKLIADREDGEGYMTEVHIEGEMFLVIQQLTSIIDRIYEKSPELFEMALLRSKYTDDVTDSKG